MSLFALPAAAVMVLGPSFFPDIFQLQQVHVASLGIGLVIAAVGFFFGRTYED
jgi:hypothetical protein